MFKMPESLIVSKITQIDEPPCRFPSLLDLLVHKSNGGFVGRFWEENLGK